LNERHDRDGPIPYRISEPDAHESNRLNAETVRALLPVAVRKLNGLEHRRVLVIAPRPDGVQRDDALQSAADKRPNTVDCVVGFGIEPTAR
jgi:hypothetical protein